MKEKRVRIDPVDTWVSYRYTGFVTTVDAMIRRL
jgi:hypothetical protein